MGRKKVKDWRYQKKKPTPIGLKNAMFLANEDLRAKAKVRRVIATDSVVNDLINDIENDYVNWDLGCITLMLYRKYGKSAEECAEFLTETQSLMREFMMNDFKSEDVWDVVREEVGLDISIED